MKKYKKYMVLVLTLLFIVCLPISGIASEWRIGTPWKKVGPNTTLAVPTDRVGIGVETPNNRLQVAELINFDILLRNTFLGFQTGGASVRWDNSFIGHQAGFSNTGGENNTFVGANAGRSNDIGSWNTFVGMGAGQVNTWGGNNTFVGANVGRSNTTGSSNTFMGMNAGFNNLAGNDNTFMGWNAGRGNTTGSRNTFIGLNAGFNNFAGNDNTFMGHSAGIWSFGGSNNTFMGVHAGVNTTGSNNTFMGMLAGHANTTGFNNTFIGLNAGRFLTDGITANSTSNNSVFIGNDTRASAAGNTNEIVIGANTTGSGSNTVTLGNPSITRTVLQGNTNIGIVMPGTPIITPQGITGTTTWGYRITARSSVGETLASVEGRTAAGNAILSATNFNRITWSIVSGAVDYRVYRTTAGGTPSTIGLIGTTTGLTFDDTGLVATTAVPTIDTSAYVGIGAPTPTIGNKLVVHDGHIVNTMTTPPGVTCNIGIPTIIGTDMGGAITTPVGATACTITFTIPWNQIYACVVSASTSTALPWVSALSNTSATFTYVTTGTPILYYHCSGR
ncbi:MAG: hypothetical protein DDT19_01953 [Syntrophomonadaceae bacterium]|nr:hypothetical protein [Bacillota bacterium]